VPLPRAARLSILIGTHLTVRTSQAALAFAVSYWVYVTTQSAAASASALFARLAPSILVSVLSGWMSDLMSPTRLYLRALATQCAGSVAISCYLAWTNSALGGLLVLIALTSLVDSFVQAGYQRSALSFVSPDDPNKSLLNGRLSIPDYSAPLIGPAAAAVSLQLGGLPALFAVDAALCLMAATVVKLNAQGPERELSVRSHPGVSPWAGFAAIFRTPSLRRLQLLFTIQNLCNGIGAGMTAALLLGAVGANKEQYAAVSMAMAASAIVGSILVSSIRIADSSRYSLMFVALGIASLAGRVIPSLFPTLVTVATGLAIRAAMGPVSGAMNQSLWLDSIDRTKQGTIFGTRRLLSQGSFPLGVGIAALIAVLVERFTLHSPHLVHLPKVGALILIFGALGLLEFLTLLVFHWMTRFRTKRSAVGGAVGGNVL
jgi:MFS transporter, DHA3 family, macrolide efflux protein